MQLTGWVHVRLALIVSLGGVFVAALIALIWQLPSAIPFLGRAPADFWALAALAIVVDTPIFLEQADRIRVRSTVSVCVCFAIFFLFGAGPAILVQAVAAAVSALGQRYFRIGGAFFVSRLIIALTVASWVSDHTGHPPTVGQGSVITSRDILWFLELTAIWFAVSHGMLYSFWQLLQPARLLAEAQQFRYDALVTASSMLLATPLIITLPAGLNLTVAIPLLAWNLAMRERIKREQLLRQDPVTGLQNYRGFLSNVASLTLFDKLRVQRFGVMLVRAAEDVPGLSAAMGRDIYEQVLVEFGRRLQAIYGRYRVGRLPGEGIVVMLDKRDQEDPSLTGKTAARAISGPMLINGIPFRFHCAAGVALSPEHGRDLESLLVRAEYAVGQAHRDDRSVVVYVPETEKVTRRRVELLAEIHAALRDPARAGEFAMAYQPQVDIDSGKLYGVEALMRWTHPDWGPVAPDEIMGAIESSDVMHELTRRVIAMVTDTMADWNRRSFPIRVAINASVQDLRERTFADEVAHAVRARGIEPFQMTIEITERMMLTGSIAVERAAERLVDLGLGLSIDDFGTGHASMQQIRLMPLTEVKIDKSYVSGMLHSRSERAIVATVHQLAGALGVTVVAEGIEDADTAAALAKLGGMVGQGWYFGRPMTGDALYDEWHRHPLRLDHM